MKTSALVLILVAAVAGLAWIWGGGEEDARDEGDPASAASRPPGAVLLKPEHVPAADPSPPPEEAEAEESKPVASAASLELLRFLDRYHRSPAAERAALRSRAPSEAAARELAEFEELFEGPARLYRQALQTQPPTSLGPEFQALALAWAKGGIEGLARRLEAIAEPGPAWKLWAEALVARSLDERREDLAGPVLGRLLRLLLEEGYPWERVREFEDEAADLMLRASSFLPSREYTVQSGDSLIAIASRFRREGVLVYWGWIQKFNGKASHRIAVGERLKIPTVPLGLEVWREARVAVLFAGDVPLRLYRVSVGQPGPDSETPVGVFTIGEHEPEPVWYRPDGGIVPYGNPENALGERWLGFVEKSSYGLHGTNSEATLGSFETQGCIRFSNDEIVELYELVPDGTKVVIHP